MLLVILFFKIFNEVLKFLHSCLDSTHTNYPTEMCEVSSVTKGKIYHFMVTMIATLQKFYNTIKILYKYNHTNYIEKLAASRRVIS
jgi:hypothetical protein